MPDGDEINDLVERVYAAISKDRRWAEPDISYFPRSKGNEQRWSIFYCNTGGWKNHESAPTLREALEAWLADYEHHYDEGPYLQ